MGAMNQRIHVSYLGPERAVPETETSHSPSEPIAESIAPPGAAIAPELGEPRPSSARFLVPILAILACLIWFGSMIWLALPVMRSGFSAIALVQFGGGLCMPPALIGIIWLLAIRSDSPVAARYSASSHQIRAETVTLEHSLAAISEKLEASRTHLAENAADFVSLGEAVAARLDAARTAIAAEILQANTQSTTFAEATNASQASLNILLASIPRAVAETTAMGTALKDAGLSATEQAAALDAQLSLLAQRGREADSIAGGAAQKLAAHIVRMEASSETASARMVNVTAEMSGAVDAVLGRTASAIDEARRGITAQGEAMLAMIEANQTALGRTSRASLDALTTRIGEIETVIDRIATRLGEQRTVGSAVIRELDAGFTDVEKRLTEIHLGSLQRNQQLAESITAVNTTASDMHGTLEAGETVARRVISLGETLLTTLDAATREVDETLPTALDRLDSRLTQSNTVIASVSPDVLALASAADAIQVRADAISETVQRQHELIEQLSASFDDTINNSRGNVAAIATLIDATTTRSNELVERAAPRLIEALLRVRETAHTAADDARDTLAAVIGEAARSIEIASAQAMQRAVGTAVERQVGAIIDAGRAAVEAGAQASDRLAEHLAKIAEAAAAVEARLQDDQALRAADESESFGRRSSLLIESLNSAAVDITKNFSADISDSAWAAYLKGDRGVFVRRAVRLLDTIEAREIVRRYDEDPLVQEQINRYIHDFEAMLRTVLAQRDGGPLGVTLLSSDIGKLYVALAQAIDRLRA